MDQELKKLISLQDVDGQINDIESLAGDLPNRVENKENHLKDIQSQLESIDENIDTNEKTPKYFLGIIDGFKNKGIFANNLHSQKLYLDDLQINKEVYLDLNSNISQVKYNDTNKVRESDL